MTITRDDLFEYKKPTDYINKEFLSCVNDGSNKRQQYYEDHSALSFEKESLRQGSVGSEELVNSSVSINSSLNTNNSLNSSSSVTLEEDGHLHFACTNARSIVEKIGSFITLFEENSLHFAILTETWLTKRHCPQRVLNDLTVGANLSFVRRDRGQRGGGVAIGYNPTKMKLNLFEISRNNLSGEYVCAIGTTTLSKRKLAIFAIYLPPSMNKKQVDECLIAITKRLTD